MADIKLEHGIWVLIADGEKALFLKNSGSATHPSLTVVREMHEENPGIREQGTDRPGRYRDPTGLTRADSRKRIGIGSEGALRRRDR